MVARKQFVKTAPHDPELQRMMDMAASRTVTEDELREQRISFAYGNAPADADRITKESVRRASGHMKLRA